MELILKYFPELSQQQEERFTALFDLYQYWNERINVVSRKDIDELFLRHVLHSLGIAKVQPFKPGSKILDVGTGGGFPGIPLAILFPETKFHLVDSIRKKTKVVREVTDALRLENVEITAARAEAVSDRFDFVVSRAVTRMEAFVPWVANKFREESRHSLENGILYLKGGDLSEELRNFPRATIYPLSSYFDEEFFETKCVVHLPQK